MMFQTQAEADLGLLQDPRWSAHKALILDVAAVLDPPLSITSILHN